MTWTPLPVDPPVPLGWGVRSARAEGGVHVLADSPDGSGVRHLVVSAEGLVEVLGTVPLAAVTGVAAGPDGLVVTGALPDGRPGVRVGAAPPVPLRPGAGPDGLGDGGSDARVAAWPVPVAGGAGVVWATSAGPAAGGSRPAVGSVTAAGSGTTGGSVTAAGSGTPGGSVTVWHADVTEAGAGAATRVLTADAVYGLQAIARGDGVDVYGEGEPTAFLARSGSAGWTVVGAPRAAVLAPGCLLTTDGAELVVHAPPRPEPGSTGDPGREPAPGSAAGAVPDPAPGSASRRFPLPRAPAGEHRRVRRLLVDGPALAWSTERLDDPTEPGTLAFAARWSPATGPAGHALTLPAPGDPVGVHVLDGGLLVVQPTDGVLALWWSEGDL